MSFLAGFTMCVMNWWILFLLVHTSNQPYTSTMANHGRLAWPIHYYSFSKIPPYPPYIPSAVSHGSHARTQQTTRHMQATRTDMNGVPVSVCCAHMCAVRSIWIDRSWVNLGKLNDGNFCRVQSNYVKRKISYACFFLYSFCCCCWWCAFMGRWDGVRIHSRIQATEHAVSAKRACPTVPLIYFPLNSFHCFPLFRFFSSHSGFVAVAFAQQCAHLSAYIAHNTRAITIVFRL